MLKVCLLSNVDRLVSGFLLWQHAFFFDLWLLIFGILSEGQLIAVKVQSCRAKHALICLCCSMHQIGLDVNKFCLVALAPLSHSEVAALRLIDKRGASMEINRCGNDALLL